MPRKQKPPRGSINEGIQADSVSAEVLAVGRNAKATKIVKSAADSQKLLDALSELRQGLESLNLNAPAAAAVQEDVTTLENTIKQDQPDKPEVESILRGIAGKLKMVGIVLSEVIALSSPVSKIAAILSLSLKSIGLG